MSKISVIISTKNRNDLLNQAVDSVINQTYNNWELYIINDSKEEIILKTTDPRINIEINKRTSGANGARNTGINLSSGEFIAFLDDDDTWEQNKLAKQLKIMKNTDVILSYTGKKIIYKKHKIEKEKYSYKKTFINPFITLQLHNYIGTTSSIMIKSEVLKTQIKFDEKINILQDYDLYIQLSKIGKFYGIPESLITYNFDKKINHISLRKNELILSARRIITKQKGIYKTTIFAGLSIIFFQKLYKYIQIKIF